MYSFNKLNRALTALAALVLGLFAGCGGGGGSAPSFTGNYAGGNIFLEKSRGGGPSVQIMTTTVNHDGTFVADATFFYPPSTTNSTGGRVSGSVVASGLVTATVTLNDGGRILISGGPLRWQTGRGGPDNVLAGPVTVTYDSPGGAGAKPAIVYAGAIFQLWR